MKRKIFKSVSDIVVTCVLGAVALIFIAVLIVGNILAFRVYGTALESYFGFTGGTQLQYDTNQYFERKAQSMDEASQLAQQMGIEAEGEGCVLLKNEDVGGAPALPLAKGNKVSLFSQSSVDIVRSGGGGSGSLDSTIVEDLKSSLDFFGIEANPTLWNFYKSKTSYRRKIGGLAQGVSYYEPYNWGINEVPQSEYTQEVKNSYSAYHDAAIVVISRTGCENGDLPRSMSVSTSGVNQGSILELDQDEKDMLAAARDTFDKVIVLLNTGNVVDCSFLEDYDVDACLWIGGIGQFGMTAVGGILAGKLSPSGKSVDTHLYDLFSAPAMQNMGNYEYWQGTTETEHHYVAYSEGIYVGYKYYETRYEDKMLGQGNAGDFDYDAVVAYPFGFGLSYTSFTWSDYKTARDGDDVIVSVKVTNSGNRPGKDVVEVYYQSPYTEYDIANKVEKSAVSLVGFAKTKKLQKGESETVSVTFNVTDMKSYDQFGKGTYYLEGSDDYYVTAASDAHKAVNNILKAKSPSLDVDGDAGFTAKLSVEEKICDKDDVTGTTVANLFDDCDGTDWQDNIKYLSRNDWSVMDDNGLLVGELTGKGNSMDAEGLEYKSELSNELKAELEKIGYAAAKAPDEDFAEPTMNADNGRKLIEFKDKDFDDPEWDALLDQLTLDDLTRITKLSGYGTAELQSVQKPHITDADGPQAFNSYIGNGVRAGGLPIEPVVAATWNQDLSYRVGDIMGELCLWVKADGGDLTGWYAPAMNIHRTPFGGRNCEYYSEDGVLSAEIGSEVVKGATDRGVMCFIKHFAMNEQDRNRMTDNVTWTREQAAREIYFKPFEASIKEGKAGAVMTSYNRIGTVWAGGNYNLITGLLREEWGFNGFVLTDYLDGVYENIDQMLAAGGDAALNVNNDKPITTTGAQAHTYMRRALHHVLYATANSNAMNGYDSTTTVNVGTPKYYYIMMWIDIAVGVVILGCLAFIPLKLFVIGKKKKSVGGDADGKEGNNED